MSRPSKIQLANGSFGLLARVMRHMEAFAPLSLADSSWDNVGLLVEAPFPRARADRVFLTIDLTEPVLEEALSDPSVGVIMAYHPPLFRPIKCLTMADTQQRIALKCSASGVSVYAPHTSLDACQNGINDWLTSGLGAGTVKPIVPTPPGPSSTGMGRLLSLSQSVPLDQLIHNVKNHLGLDKLRVARRHSEGVDTVKSVAVCAGSGGSILRGVAADVYLSGEMSHHEVLAALASHSSVILCEHSNTERGYLASILAPHLQSAFAKEGGASVTVVCSQKDSDPLKIE